MKINHNGISLVEMMVAMAIISFLMMALQSTLLVSQNSWNHSNSTGQIQQSISQGLSRLVLDLNSAESLLITDGGNQDILKFLDISAYNLTQYEVINNQLIKQILDYTDQQVLLIILQTIGGEILLYQTVNQNIGKMFLMY